MDDCLLLEAARFVNKHLPWFIINKLVSVEAAKLLPSQINTVIKAVGKHTMSLCEAFNIPQHTVYAPIYTGYKEYYKADKTQGEHYNLRPKF